MSNQWNGSYVMEEFVKIAKEQGFLPSKLKEDGVNVVGNPYTDTPVEKHTRNEKTEEYGVTKEEDIIEKAHPKTVQTAKAQGKGGVVENGNEQQKIDIEVATRMPHGSLIGVHAELVNELVKLANFYDSIGHYKKANRIDYTIKKIYRPFDGSRLHKEANPALLIMTGIGIAAQFLGPWIANKLSGPEDARYKTQNEVEYERDAKGIPILDERDRKIPTGRSSVGKVPTDQLTKARGIGGKMMGGGALATALGVLGMLGSYVTSIQEDLQTDVGDLYDVLMEVDAPSAKNALEKLTPFWKACQSVNLADSKNLGQFKDAFDEFVKVFPSIIQDVNKAKIEDPSIWPYGAVERALTKLNDVKTGISDMTAQLKDIGGQVNKVEEEAKKDIKEEVSSSNIDNDVLGLQKILAQHGFNKKRWNIILNGDLDQPTIQAAKELESLISSELEKLFVAKKGRKPSKSYDIIDNNNNIIMDPREIINDIDVLEQALTK
jgi:hypothetical protein